MTTPLGKLWAGYGFDLDGTLIDTAPDLGQALNHALTTFGYDPVEDTLARRFIGHGALVMIERGIEHQNAKPTELEPMLDTFLEYYAANICVHSKPYPRVLETLEALNAAGAKLAVVTNKREGFAKQLIGELGWTDHFVTIIGGDTAPAPKPAADPIELTCKRLDVGLDELLFVGDSKTDVGAARSAGVPVVCLRDGYNEGIDPEELGADAIIDTFAELIP